MFIKSKLILVMLIFITSCDIYRVFKENKIIIEFLNNDFYNWSIEENNIINEYNKLITGENFKSEILWMKLNSYILPKTIELRETINSYSSKNKEIEELRNISLEKIDILIEGFDMIKKGFENKKNPDLNIIYKGRDRINIFNQYNKKINEKVQKIIKDYYIKPDELKRIK
ncbi:MAG TPA: hypothetical protein PKW55_01295 [Spirochaetota bacterium]|nr:hypothetical protein [Spirochaetota bacterium]HPQ49169.1 hypothetical protein [Spirochaetota bacterium]